MSKVNKMNKEIKDLTEIIELAAKSGKDGAFFTKWYSEITTIIDARISELHERISMLEA